MAHLSVCPEERILCFGLVLFTLTLNDICLKFFGGSLLKYYIHLCVYVLRCVLNKTVYIRFQSNIDFHLLYAFTYTLPLFLHVTNIGNIHDCLYAST
jgi:hypothetical protein